MNNTKILTEKFHKIKLIGIRQWEECVQLKYKTSYQP